MEPTCYTTLVAKNIIFSIFKTNYDFFFFYMDSKIETKVMQKKKKVKGNYFYYR